MNFAGSSPNRRNPVSNGFNKPRPKLTLGRGQKLLPDPNSSNIQSVPLTKSHFLDAYSKGKWNLSNVPCPACFQGIDFISPPEHYNEITRLEAVKKFINLEQWDNKKAFNHLIREAMKCFNTKGASISLIDEKRQLVKYEISLNIRESARTVSIDAHTLLSKENFVLLDASKDWRTANNPFVKGQPNIRFYVGTPLINTFGIVIGALAVFDPFPRTRADLKQLEQLKELAHEIITILTTPLNGNDFSMADDSSSGKTYEGSKLKDNEQLPLSIYEKDGSGSQYTPNLNFRYSKQDSQDSQRGLSSREIIRHLSQARDIKKASTELAKIIAEKYQFDVVCIIEMKVSQNFQIPSDFFPPDNSIEAETFKFANKLIKTEKEQVMSRILGIYGSDVGDLDFGTQFFYKSLSSEFGVYYESISDNMIKLRSGVCMPFYRTSSKIVRKRKIVKSDNISSSKPIEVLLRAGGYLISAFSEDKHEINESMISFVYGSACSLRRVYISN